MLSCASIFAADPSLQQFSLVKTNNDVVLIEDVFTRNGETNLIRNTLTRNGAFESRTQKFYQRGLLVGEHWTFPDSSGFITEANLPYTMILRSSPSNHISFAYICSADRIVIDYFIATNGIFWPVDATAVQEARRLTTEVQKAITP
jgi:hypothetical protein